MTAKTAHTVPAARIGRDALMAVLRRIGPATATDLAQATGLHENTVREHMKALIEERRVHSGSESRGTRGRPKIVYSVSPTEEGFRQPTEQEESQARTEVMRLVLSRYGEPLENAPAVARADGRDLAAELPAVDVSAETVDEQLDAVTAHFARMGFDPVVPEGTMEIHLRRCPFRDMAIQRPEIICSMHVGIAEGVLDELGSDLEVTEALPFVTPRECIVRLGLANPGEDVEG